MSYEKKIAEQFPCEFPIKVFGLATEEFELNVLSIIHKHLPDLREDAIRTRFSKDKKYLAITITTIIDSKERIDNIYLDLTASPHVLIAI